ncbi:uncharacterized protein LOC120895167 isoform X1 [Anopheles arabiensis]|uniref:uncharacterized protein LOC120895167 isoform X1 n=2 Tax=Anopheles arabiensis TaxID=7173 RepID=UPI001AAD45AE|nr:uncharacterized protein LOC120895167 isoform X1 [Anopheles arabiensis]
MSYTEYSKELEAFIAKQRQLLELDKERIQRIKQEDPHTQHTPSRAEELQKDDHSLEEIASDNCPANDKLSKEKVNSQLSKKTATVPEVEAGPSGKAPPKRNVPSTSSIDSWTNMDHRARNVVAAPTTPTDAAPSPPPATVLSAARAKQMSPQQDEMEQWVSDTFFSYFPSFNKKQKEKKTVLSRTRQQEYQEYLKNVNFIANAIPEVTTKHQQYMQKYGTGKSPGGTEATNEKGTGNAPTSPPAGAGTGPGGGATGQPQVRFGKSLVAEGNSNYRKGSPREKLIQDLAHTDLPTILNTDTIDRRNRMLADEESRRKLEYQKELIKQIEEKRKEVERLREKEKLEEEMLTSRLEQQLKTMQLEEQLEHERLRSEKIRIANEQNHIRRLQLLANLENDHKVFNPYDGQRKAFSENGGKAAAAAASSETKPTVPQPNGGAFSSGDERTKAAYQRYISNSATQQQEKQQPTTHLHPFVSVAPAVSTNALALSTEQEDYESSSETTADTSVMVGGGGGAVEDHRFQYCKSCRADGDRSRLPLQPALGKHSKRRQHCAKCKRPEAYNGGKRGEDANSRCIRCERTMKRAMNGTKGASLCAVCTLSTEADQQNKNFLYHPKKQQYHHTERRHHRAPLETDDDDVQVHRAVANTTTTATVSPSQKNPFKVIDIQYHESDNEHGDLDVLNPVIVRNNYRKPPFSLNIDKDSLFHPSKKPPEPVFTVNIRNGEVFVDNKLRSGGAGRPSRYAPPDSPPLSDGDGETSSATVGDDLMDDRIAKYVRHYNTLWMKRGNGRKGNSNGQQHNDYHHHHHSSHHHQHHHNHREQEQHSNDRAKGNKTGPLLPSLSPPKVYVSDRPDNLKSDALKLMEKKWEVPAVERTKVNEKGSTRVLTQLGAIRKQLQLEQLQMDGGPSGYSKNY